MAGTIPTYLDSAELARLPEAQLWSVRPGRVTASQKPVADRERVLLAGLGLAAVEVPDVGPDNLPARLEVEAWVVHAGKPNRNRFALLSEDLERLAPTVASAPNLLPMDWNHGALIPGRGPEAIGAWYGAEFAMDPEADNGRGLMGLRFRGVVWAWLFPEEARQMLALQDRLGAALFSVGALASSELEVRDPRYGSYKVLINPSILTVSALSVTPADEDALGAVRASFGPAAADNLIQLADACERVFIAAGTDPAKENSMTAEELTMLTNAREAQGRLEARLQELEGQAEQARAAHATALAEQEAKLAAQAAEHEAKLAELASARDGLAAQKTQAETALAELQVELERLRGIEAEVAAVKAAAEQAALVASRRSELPEEFLVAHDARDEGVRTRVEARWASLDEEAWTQYRDEELLVGFTAASGRQGYVARSAGAGRLPGTGTVGDNVQSRARSLIK